MSMAFKQYVEENGLVFDSKQDRIKEFKEWKKRTKIYGETLTEQHHAEDLDLNKIFPKFDKAGIARLKSQVTVDENKLVDLVGFDYKESMDNIKRVESEFNDLPSGVRAKFDNNPSKYLEYLSRPQKAAEEVKEIIPEESKQSKKEAPKEPEGEKLDPKSAPKEG